MNPLIKWPGGKSGEISKFKHLIPNFERYIEPFFGGGALFFYLSPQKASINDTSSSLMDYYTLLKAQDRQLYDLLLCYSNSFANIISICNRNYGEIYNVYRHARKEEMEKKQIIPLVDKLTQDFADQINYGFTEQLLLNSLEFTSFLNTMVADKITRTILNDKKRPFSGEDLKANLITGFTSGYYMYFRKVFNDINLLKITTSLQYKIANFYFIREYCYGSMFRYNSKGEFNVPYGGMSYNKKNFTNKIDSMFTINVEAIFKNTDIYCTDFADFFNKAKLQEKDFMFLDPPYDSDFSDYDGKIFSLADQERLSYELKKTLAKFMLVIKQTDFIYDLYKDNFNILSFDNQYTYNVRSRNKRNVEHLIITNLPNVKNDLDHSKNVAWS